MTTFLPAFIAYALHIQWHVMFDWDVNNLRKIRAHRITQEEAEQTLANGAIPV